MIGSILSNPTRRANARQILADARNIIEMFGWTQHRYGVGTAPHCATGAIYDAPWITTGACADAVSVLGYAVHCDGVTAWNDHPDRTKADVVAALREAEELLA